MSTSSRLWLPDHGPAGLIVVARPRPLALVMGGRIVEAEERPSTRETSPAPRESRTASGLIILSRSTRTAPTRIVGHPDLATHARYRRGDTLYVSIAEAVHREAKGESVELHFEPDDADREALEGVAERARRQWDNDALPDAWMRPRKRNAAEAGNFEPHGSHLQYLEEAIRNRRGRSTRSDLRELPPT